MSKFIKIAIWFIESMSQKVFNIMFSCAIAVLGVSIYHLRRSVENIKPPEVEVEYIVNKKQPDFFSKSPQEGLIEALEYYVVKHPEIVYAQAVLETGNFTSEKYKVYNNLFGLYNSKRKRYYRFKHWTHSVKAYVDMIQYKYKEDNSRPPNDYYRFLQKVGYAKDPNYINKLKGIVSRNDKRRNT